MRKPFRRRNRFYNQQDNMIGIGLFLGATILALGAPKLGNNYHNNRVVDQDNYTQVSKAQGWLGHTDLVKYDNGSQDIKFYPSFGHRGFASKFSEDFDGDGLVDKIREHAGEMRFNKATKILFRDDDYTANKALFDEENARLANMNKYASKKLD